MGHGAFLYEVGGLAPRISGFLDAPGTSRRGPGDVVGDSPVKVTDKTSRPTIRSKCRRLAVPTRHPAVMAVAATSRSCARMS